MPEMNAVRAALPRDADQIMETWRSSFGDGQPFLMDFFASTGLAEHAVVAEAGGKILSMVFAFPGQKLGGRTADYLYAHCTRPEYRGRGLGAAVLRAMTERCFARGAELVLLAPPDGAREAWYRRALGAEVLQRAADLPVEKAPVTSAECRLIDHKEYVRLRERESAALSVTPQLLAAQGVLHGHYGGVMVHITLDGAPVLACAEPKGSAILVRELLCAPEDRGRAMTVLSAHLWHKATFLRQCAPQGRALMFLGKDGAEPPERPGPLFPFTLD